MRSLNVDGFLAYLCDAMRVVVMKSVIELESIGMRCLSMVRLGMRISLGIILVR